MKTIKNRKTSEKTCSTSISSSNKFNLSHQSNKENFAVKTSTDKLKNNKNSNNQISQESRSFLKKSIPKNNGKIVKYFTEGLKSSISELV